MRVTIKKQIENLIDLIKKAHENTCEAIDSKNYKLALELLEECQSSAIQIGTMIEQSEGEGFVTVGMLEEYCELTYQIHSRLSQSNLLDVHRLSEELEEHLIHIVNSIREDIKVRCEAVFLPYKSSMWDSLESVWKKMDADPDVDAYVIPIPYYDKNSDGSFREMHYEGDQYPDYVPITRYDTFDFERHQPNMIFIHNPYDEYNYVTSVEPFFYAKNLKKYTENLIYIPYFVLVEIDPKNQRAVEEIEHFVTLPGVIHANKVIVQSENMRQIYIDVMTKYAGEQTRQIWEQKILGSGSPKLDKVRNIKQEDLEIPKEWMTIIQKPNGDPKKIVLYNTSVGALLNHGEKMLVKIQDVFRIFKEKQNDVALLWRPHPLIQATIESMRPQLWETYQKIVEQYKEEGWGIYDDTADLDRAIVLCDAYYGDGSSVIRLCQETGKPVMLQNVDV